jgi:GH24 family phage-related lysozyme (muramidase)
MIDCGPDLTKHFEGYDPSIYICPAGYVTTGWGSKLDDRPFKTTREWQEQLFRERYAQAEKACDALGLDLDGCRRAAVVDLIYNLGAAGFAKFHATLAALKMRDWISAATCLEQSRWYKQVGRRGPRIVSLIRTGRWDSLDKI